MSKKLKIAYFLDNFYPQVNGVVTSSINTAAEMERRGHSIFGVVPRPPSFTDYQDDYFPFPIHFANGFPALFYPDFQFTNPFSNKIYKIMKDFAPDIIHFHAPFTLGYMAIRIARKLKIPVVGTFHTFFAEPEYLLHIGMEKSKMAQRIGWWFSNQFFDRCDAVVSPGKYTAGKIVRKNLRSKVHVVSNGVDCTRFQSFKYTGKLPVEIKKDDEWMLYIGRISHEKGLDVLLEAAIKVMERRKNAKLILVGDGPYKKELQVMAGKHHLSDRVVFTGTIPNKDLLESGLLNKVKFFTSASTSENQPMTILESIMFGLPIIGVDAKGIPELVEDNGFIVPPDNPSMLADKLELLLKDKRLHKKHSNQSLQLSAKYDIRNTTNQMEALYLRTIEEKKSNFVDIKEIE